MLAGDRQQSLGSIIVDVNAPRSDRLGAFVLADVLGYRTTPRPGSAGNAALPLSAW